MSANTHAPDLTDLVRRRSADAGDRLARFGWADPAVRAFGAGGVVRDRGDGVLAFADPDGGLVRGSDGTPAFDAKTASAKFVISTPNRARHGDWVVPEGCKGRLDRYAKNPVVFFGHNSTGLPIGSACHPTTRELAVSVADGRGVVSTCFFHLKTQESEDVCRLVEAGELRASSIGFWPIKGRVVERRSDPADREKPVKLPDGSLVHQASFDPWISFVFDEWELFEWSVVPVPANPDCVALRLSKGFNGKPLSDAVRGYLAPFAPPAVASAPGFGPGAQAIIAFKASDAVPVADPTDGPPATPAETPADAKRRLPHGASLLQRLARRLSDASDYLCREREVIDRDAVKDYATAAESKLAALRDETVEFALATYPDIDFGKTVEVTDTNPADGKSVDESASVELTAKTIPGPLAALELTAAADLDASLAAEFERAAAALAAQLDAVMRSQDEAVRQVRRVTGRIG